MPSGSLAADHLHANNLTLPILHLSAGSSSDADSDNDDGSEDSQSPPS